MHELDGRTWFRSDPEKPLRAVCRHCGNHFDVNAYGIARVTLNQADPPVLPHYYKELKLYE